MGKITQRGSIALTAAIAVVLSSAGAAGADEDFEFERIDGKSRYETSAKIGAAFDAVAESDAAVLASGEDEHFSDALAANYLAGNHGAPILLTDGDADEVSDVTLAQLEQSDVSTIYIVGGEMAVSAAQEEQLEAAGYDVVRVAGSDRFGTAEAVVEHVGDAESDTAFIATGWSFADALSAGPVSYAAGMPVALADEASIAESLVEELKAAGITNAVVLGGENAVPQAVIDQLEAADIDVADDRLAGDTRSGTSVAVAEYAIDNDILGVEGVNLASGRQFSNGADALSGGPLSAIQGRALLISESSEALDRLGEENVADFLRENADTLTAGNVFGGPLAISAAVVETAQTAARGEVAPDPTTNQTFVVTPDDGVVLTIATPDDTSDDRVYTVENAVADAEHQIVLAEAANVTVGDDGVVTFEEAGSLNEADFGTVSAEITVVNGVPNTGQSAEITPSSGSFTFRVDGVADETIIPVVYFDENEDGDLNLDADDAPTEPFGIGGAINFNPAEAETGDDLTPAAEVTEVDGDSFVAGGSTWNFDSNDTFTIEGSQATYAEFQEALQVDDEIEVTDYQRNPALISTFDLTNNVPAAPTVLGTDAGQNSVTVNLDDIVDDATVTVYYTVDTDVADTTLPALDTNTFDSVESTEDGDSDEPGYQVTVSGLDAAEDYQFYAVQEDVSGESPATAGFQETTDADVAPEATTAVPNDINDGVGSTNEILVSFSEAVTVNDASGITLTVNGFTITGVSAEADNEANTRYVITLDRTLNDAPSTDEPTYEANIAADTVTDSTGNENVEVNNFASFVY